MTKHVPQATPIDADRKRRLEEFVVYARSLSGDEKGEAQVFLDRLFRGFGRDGYKEAGATLEYRVKNNRRGTSFADLVWKPRVLIEMKKRGEDLSKHLTQAFEYWVRLAPNRPRYVVLCNFDEFRVFDFDVDINEPQDSVTIGELPQRYGPLSFLFPTNDRPVFGADREHVTRAAADLLAQVYNTLSDRKDVGPELAQRFVLQMLVSLFSEDIGLLPKHFVTQLLEDCTQPSRAFDLLRGLFTAMNSRDRNAGGRFKEVAYFNGGLFSVPAPIELSPNDELVLLKQAACYNWAHISPDIFGTIFQHSLGATKRRSVGAHYTAQADIMKIIGPTIGTPWRTAISAARSPAELYRLRERLQQYRVLDPACGSGNFLYLAYRELKRIEKELIDRLRDLGAPRNRKQREFGFISSRQFFGMDVLPFAVELAKVTMTLAHKLSIDELHIEEQALPLDNLDANIVCQDALIDSGGQRTAWPAADVIIGNPPFLGAKRLKPEHGSGYVNSIRALYPEVPGMADYCVYWFRRAHDHLPECTAENPTSGRAGLVGTQNIRSNQSRVGGLDYIASTGTIVDATENHPWSGEANVHVSIVNWVKSNDAKVIPSAKRLWTHIDSNTTSVTAMAKEGPRAKSGELIPREVKFINSSLSDDSDLSVKVRLACNVSPKRCFQGKIPGYSEFLVDRETATRLQEDSAEVVFPYLTGRELLDDFHIERWVIDFGNRDMVGASQFRSAFAHCQRFVMPAVEESLRNAQATGSDMVSARTEHRERWWQLWNRRDEMSRVLGTIPRYIGCSRVTRRPIMVFLSSRICPSDLVQVFAFPDDYSFGILQSALHFEWFRKSSRLKVESDSRYSVREVFETFPWPQRPSVEQVRAVAAASRQVRSVRERAAVAAGGGLRNVYRTLELPGRNIVRSAHEELDRAVREAYGMESRTDALGFLLDLNKSVAASLTADRAVERPGLPSIAVNGSEWISDDYLQA